jgi:hypothetical protein
MELWTIQMAQWRTAKDLGIPFLDTTVKSGDKVFAPTWDIVTGVKSGAISEATYTEEYKRLMRASYRSHQSRWLSLCESPVVAISCYCPEGQFCHRHLLAGYLENVCNKHAIPFVLKGELTRHSK